MCIRFIRGETKKTASPGTTVYTMMLPSFVNCSRIGIQAIFLILLLCLWETDTTGKSVVYTSLPT